jgi:hypothetical protein
MTYTIISFQFSPVRIIKIVLKLSAVVSKLYLETSPSSSYNLPWKNYLAKSEKINRYKSVKNPKFEIAEIDWSTVVSKILSEVQDLIILNTLKSLKALKTDSPDFSASCTSSTKLRITTMQSKMLKPSCKYFFIPRPNIFKHISRANMTVKI